ncbi:Rv3235 family protein [Isoptericola croceus]|uniref:Rv3235 family protein n=1 Tax=Isoptericola croceus TaxID=3031406 RepID=UPI0023F9700E|nr:Rv3235 family protein [Isoptericola croceus]
MTTTASENVEPAGTGARRLRVASPPRARRPAAPPRASRRPEPVRRVRIGAVPADPTPTPGRPLPAAPAAPTRLPDPTAMCGSVVRAAVEVLRGDRPATHIARWVTPQVLDQLVHRAQLVQARRSETRTGVPVTVRRIRTVRLGDSTAEATVVLEDDGRVRAAAVRLEARRGVWRVAVLELG